MRTTRVPSPPIRTRRSPYGCHATRPRPPRRARRRPAGFLRMRPERLPTPCCTQEQQCLVGPSRPKAVGRSTTSWAPSRCPTRTPSRPEFFELEREAIFKRAWLNVGRVEQLPRNGSYFTKELDVAKTSVVVVRGSDGKVRAFYNICRHRGNKLVWNDFPQGGDERHLPASSPASTTVGATTSTARCSSSNKRASSSTSTRREYGLVPCTATSGRASSSSTWPRSPSRASRSSSAR
jgi:hypothetical protein